MQLRAPAVVLEGMNDSDGNTITPEYSVSAAMQSSALAIKHYPDPQAMPDAKLILSTENADAAALRRGRCVCVGRGRAARAMCGWGAGARGARDAHFGGGSAARRRR